jgi:hypothetical protein
LRRLRPLEDPLPPGERRSTSPDELFAVPFRELLRLLLGQLVVPVVPVELFAELFAELLPVAVGELMDPVELVPALPLVP